MPETYDPFTGEYNPPRAEAAGRDTTIRDDVQQSYNKEMDDQLRGLKIFDFHKSMGGRLEYSDVAGRKGWAKENVDRFNQLLDEEAPDRQSFGDSIKQGMIEKKMDFHTYDENGTEVIEMGQKRDPVR
jgi:hypothetical protein